VMNLPQNKKDAERHLFFITMWNTCQFGIKSCRKRSN
jgi:hypothetical protein